MLAGRYDEFLFSRTFMRTNAKSFDGIREYLETVPLVDCHDHSAGAGPAYKDPVHALISNYMVGELTSASCEKDVQFILDCDQPLDKRWPVLEKTWKRTCHTGYAQLVRMVLREFYGEDELTLKSLRSVGEKMLDLEDEKVFDSLLEKAKIAVRLEDMCGLFTPELKSVVDKSLKLSPRGRLVVSLPRFHKVCSYEEVSEVGGLVGMRVTSLDEYLEACRKVFQAHIDYGAAAFKDQSAYTRSLDYGNPSRAQAEEVFNWFMEDPRRSAGYPDQVKPLDDFLFHEFLRMIRDFDLPLQVHTGHMAGNYNDIYKTNAVFLNKVIELHKEVRFDLFHANWPYSGELLFLAKNHPNVTIDFCWANIIDPVYCQNMFRQILSSVPHGKVHGYGSDFGGCAEFAWAHASMARDNIAIALADMVEMEYIGVDDAKQVGYDWLFGNANEYYRLGL